MGKLRKISLIFIILGILLLPLGFLHIFSIGEYSANSTNKPSLGGLSGDGEHAIESEIIPAAPFYFVHSTEITLKFDTPGQYKVSIRYRDSGSNSESTTPYTDEIVDDETFSCNFDEWMSSFRDHQYIYIIEEVGDLDSTDQFSVTEEIKFSSLGPSILGGLLFLLGILLVIISLFTDKGETRQQRPVSYTPEPTMNFGDSFGGSSNRSKSRQKRSRPSKRKKDVDLVEIKEKKT